MFMACKQYPKYVFFQIHFNILFMKDEFMVEEMSATFGQNTFFSLPRLKLFPVESVQIFFLFNFVG